MNIAVLILISGILIRLPGLFRPLLGNFATKSATYAIIAKNFCSDPATFFRPTVNFIVNGQKSLHMTEWPFFSYLTGTVHKLIPVVGLDATGRFLNIILFVLSGLFVYKFVRDLWSREKAFLSLFFYMFFPLGIVYSQSFQLESSIALCIATTFYLVNSWVAGRRSYLRGLALWLSITILLLMKIQMLCLTFPVVVFLALDYEGRRVFKRPLFYVFFLTCLVLPLAWYKYTFFVARHYENVFFSVLYSVMIRTFPDPRLFTPDFYVKVFYILSRNVFSPVGLALGAAGFLKLIRNRGRWAWFMGAYILAVAVYFLAMPRKIYEMDYYYTILLFPGAIAAAQGITLFREKWLRTATLGLFALLSLALAWNPAFKTPENELNFVSTGNYVRSMVPERSWIILCSPGSPAALLYYTGRSGFAIPVSEINYTPLEVKARKKLSLIHERSPRKLFDIYREQGGLYFVSDDEEWLASANPGLYSHIVSSGEVYRKDGALIVNLEEIANGAH